MSSARPKKPFAGFIFWDGEECDDAGYCLFGCSIDSNPPTDESYIQHPMLRTSEMLDLVLRVGAGNPGASHVAFSFDYDVNQILCDLSWPYLITLKIKGEVKWHGYTIKHIPHKIFTVEKDRVRVHIDDIFSYFRCRYDKALGKFDVSDEETRSKITAGKDQRADFHYSDIDYIRSYWTLELQTGCQLMDRVRRMTYEAGFPGITQWYGPGALAAYSLKAHDTKDFMKKSPAPVLRAALSAYAGGWFERFSCGVYNGPVYTADINSAYVYAMSLLPNLANGRWRYASTDLVREARECRFGLFHVKWAVDFNGYLKACHGIPFPLFHRDSNGSVKRPFNSDVWLWNPEAANASATPYAQFTEAWIFESDEEEYPFEWVAAMFDTRLAMQAAGDPSEKILKWALASYYGRLAQRTGWNERTKIPPMFHQIEWAGWITSKCRSMIYREALDVAQRGGLVSIDTDGIISTVPFRNLVNGEGNQLGRWKVEEFDGLIYIQNGFYWMHCSGCSDHDGAKWHDPKLRGIPRAKLDPDIALKGLRSDDGHIAISRHTFRGYGAALHGKRSEWRKWVDDDIVFSVQVAGSRVHVPQFCRACGKGQNLDEGLHDLVLSINRDTKSRPHNLPWLEGYDSDEVLRLALERERRVTHVTLEDEV